MHLVGEFNRETYKCIFIEDDKYVNIVLRIVVSEDNPEYKNSIITAIGESTKRFQQRLRNNKPLYKKE